jgi:2-keto-4-pentenoate hydratase/2-oxohepta-3-ene-1,7-dioic acid hydratase in catechol pathway
MFTFANVAGRAALVAGDDYFDLEDISDGSSSADPMTALASGADVLHRLGAGLEGRRPTGTLTDAILGAPVPQPRQVFAIGLNYASHAAESAMDVPTVPVVFAKFAGCISAPNGEIVVHNETIDYEAEVVVVIGRTCRSVGAEHAWDHVVGVTGGQDVSDRALQFAARPPHFDLGKSRDGYGPIGPVLVSVDSLADRDDIAVECRVNGEVRQRSSTAELIFAVPALIEYLSSILTLYPGDLIFTGTPDGVGMSSGRLLRPGDVVETRIGGVGSMTNRCVAS